MRKINLTEGNIAKTLVKLALPIMGTSFMQMAYNLTDLIWVGKLGSNAVTAVGTAGFFTWVAMAFIMMSRIGGEISVAQSTGKGDIKGARYYTKTALQMNFFLSILYIAFLVAFRNQLIGFFNLKDADIFKEAVLYLTIVAFGLFFHFLNQVLSGIFTGYGDSRTPFRMNAIGLVINIVLDPVLILGLGPCPRMEVKGAAIATVFAQFVVTLSFLVKLKGHPLFHQLQLISIPDFSKVKHIANLGFPVALREGLFASFSIVIARIIATWGPIPIAVQKIGAQIEALSWMTSSGFATALAAFVGQNYGAEKWDRIKKGFFVSLGIVTGIGIGATFLFYFGAGPIFSIFLSEEEALKQGIIYLKILSFSQVFMCIEIITGGAFNGLGKTLPPALVGIILTGLRIPIAMFLSKRTSLGLKGVWWSISGTSVIKGIILIVMIMPVIKALPKTEASSLQEGNLDV
jgi:putative MATE family efflux protein